MTVTVTPEKPVSEGAKLRAEAKLVAMAGDGINISTALSEAEVGISMGNDTVVAMQSAGITLVKGEPMNLSHESETRESKGVPLCSTKLRR